MKRKNIIILMISLSLVLLLGSSYALLRSTVVGNTPYVINVGTIQVTFEDDQTEVLTLENMYPMSDKEGSSQSKELGFVVKNTGNIEARYNVYLEETSTTPKFKNHIRFISNKNNQGYNEPKTMGYDKYIDLEARLGVSESASYKVKVWLDYDAGNEYMNETFTAKVVVESSQVDTSNTLYTKINNSIKEHPGTTIEEDNVTYLSGSNDEVNYNYVWYSGKLWRITSINQDGTIKMITNSSITTISFGESNELQESSNVYKWLNEDFLDTLYNYKNIIVEDYKWNITGSNDYATKIPETNTSLSKIGLITVYEYYRSYKNSQPNTSYLNNGLQWWTLTPYDDSEKIWCINGPETIIYSNRGSSKIPSGIRPIIVLKKNVEIVKGNGSLNEPYILKGDNNYINKDSKLNSRIVGEYVKFNNENYRISNIFKDGSIKITKNDYLRDSDENIITRIFSNSSNIYGNDMSDTSLASYLNSEWYNGLNINYKNMLIKGIYYIGDNADWLNYKSYTCLYNTNDKVKDCEKTNIKWEGYVGIIKYSEMFSAKIGDMTEMPNCIWIMNSTNIYNNGEKINIYGGLEGISTTATCAIKPTITLSDKVIITGGTGMENNPFEIKCDSCNT